MGSFATKIPYTVHVSVFPNDAQDVKKGKARVDFSLITVKRTVSGENIIRTDKVSPSIPIVSVAVKHPRINTIITVIKLKR